MRMAVLRLSMIYSKTVLSMQKIFEVRYDRPLEDLPAKIYLLLLGR